MAYSPEIRNEAFQLYLLGNGPDAIAKELRRRHGEADVPSAKTVEKWRDAHSWSEKRYAAERAAEDAATRDFVTAKTKLVSGMMKIQQLQQERVARGYENADDAPPENLAQEVYALTNLTRSVEKMLDSKLAEEARRKDAVDCLIEACRRIVPGWESLEVKIRQEFEKLTAAAKPDAGTRGRGDAATPV
jgi:hypothetical protein